VEFEQWATLRAGKAFGVYDAWDLRSEFEVGLTDRLTTAFYLNFQSEHIDQEVDGQVTQEDSFKFDTISSEWKYKLLDPTADPIGLLGYLEVSTSFHELEVEEKVIVGKNFDRLVLALNAILEEKWEFENEETVRELELEFAAGAAYRITDRFAVGLEVSQRNVYEDMNDFEHSALFLGPVLHYGRERWWASLTILPQVAAFKNSTDGSLDLDEWERAEARLIFGISF
jgi:hypothetical protein